VTNIIIGAHVSSSGGIFKSIERGEAIEAEAIQIFPSAPQMWRQTNHKPEAITKFRELHAASTIGAVWLHNIYLANLAAETPAHLEKSVSAVVHALTVADAIGADGVVLHTGSHKGAGMDAVVDQVSEALTHILDEAPGSAILALENAAGQGGAIGKAFSELGMLIERVNSPRLQVCLDTCHTFAAGYDISTAEAVAATVAEFDRAIGLDKLAVLHANDSKMELGGLRDRHANIGEGFIGAAGFKAMLAHPAFEGKVLLLEVPGFPGEDGAKADGPDLENVNRLKQIRDAVLVH
jgi:deoxyribonuclease-4